jgi:hypothetical protein
MIDAFAKWVQISADAVTTIIGLLALYGLVFKKEKLKQLVAIVLNRHFNDQLRAIHATTEQLRKVSLDEKDQAKRVRNLLSQLYGQLKTMSEKYPRLKQSYDILGQMISEKRITENRKTVLINEIEAELKEQEMADFMQVVRKD